jgi:hypothetical protein
MTPEVSVDLSDGQERSLVVGLQFLLGVVILGGVFVGRIDVAVAAALALAVTLLPALLERHFDDRLDPGLVLWLTLSITLHTVGSLGLYTQFQWFDEIAHTVSAIVIAGLGYASFRAFELHSSGIDVPPAFRSLFIVVFVLATGVLWEVLEFALGGFLVTVYGIDDIVTDLIFNGVGAIIVALWGTNHLTDLVGFFSRRLSGS